MKRINSTHVLLILPFILLLSCKKTTPATATTTGGGSGGNVVIGAPASIQISLSGTPNAIGKTVQATALVKDASGNVVPNQTIGWSSFNDQVFTVNTQGQVTVTGIGTTELRATSGNLMGKLSIEVGANRNVLARELNCLCDSADFPTQTGITFTAPIMQPTDLAYIVPLGLMVKGHVTPIDHQYYYPLDFLSTKPQKAVLAPADGYIVKVERTGQFQVEQQLTPRDNYNVLIQHSCNVYTYYTLITGLTTELANAVGTIPQGGTKHLHMKVTAGQQVAWVSGQSLDVNVYDINTPAKKWIIPTNYTEAAKRFATDPFLYYTPAVKTALQAKTLRTGDPLGGRFDYDEDGKLVGTWFLQGSNGYAGVPNQGNDYWRGHLSFAYSVYNTNYLEISIGRWYKPGATDTQVKEGWQFSVVGNQPDFTTVTQASGPVKYELAFPEYLLANNQPWNRQTHQGPMTITTDRSPVEGVLLVQLMGQRLLKVEAFPGKRASEVTGFTANAQLYER
jgi:hypothetical protein